MKELVVDNVKIWTLGDEGTIERGWLYAENGVIAEVGAGALPERLRGKGIQEIDGRGRHLLPGLVDCHTHLMEYAAAEMHQAIGQAQAMAAVANLLLALRCGIVATGEHHLGHPFLSMPMADYREILKQVPMASSLCFGCCQLGFEPLVFTSCTRPGEAFSQDVLTDEEYREMARQSDFPGESLFVNYTCANAPLETAPHAGELAYSRERLAHIIRIFHSEGKQVGAHIEGDEAARLFIQCGGDVVHHGHALSPETASLLAEKGVSLVITPAAGTSKRPTSPEEAYSYYKKGISLALASDAYIPPHPEAKWVRLPHGFSAGPQEFLTICGSTLRYFVDQGVPKEEALRLITVNGRKLLHPNEPEATLSPGRPADLILCDQLPALESENPGCIRLVITQGQIQICRL